jgi:hypothetical protein
VTANVIAISPRLSRWHQDEVLVTMQTDDGLTDTKSILRSHLTCGLGDKALIEARGITLIIDDQACQNGPPLPLNP